MAFVVVSKCSVLKHTAAPFTSDIEIEMEFGLTPKATGQHLRCTVLWSYDGDCEGKKDILLSTTMVGPFDCKEHKQKSLQLTIPAPKLADIPTTELADGCLLIRFFGSEAKSNNDWVCTCFIFLSQYGYMQLLNIGFQTLVEVKPSSPFIQLLGSWVKVTDAAELPQEETARNDYLSTLLTRSIIVADKGGTITSSDDYMWEGGTFEANGFEAQTSNLDVIALAAQFNIDGMDTADDSE